MLCGLSDKNSTERRKLRDRNDGRKPAASRGRKHSSVATALGWEMIGLRSATDFRL